MPRFHMCSNDGGHTVLRLGVGLMVIALTLMLGACAGGAPTTDGSPMDTFQGPECFYGTVGSMARLQGYQPMSVAAYGVVVNLPNTGSREVPRTGGLRERLIAELQQAGFGSYTYGMENLTPKQLLEHMGTAVVAVRGMIPAGAKAGTRFDLLVTALPQTQTTSLAGGDLLYPTSMSPHGMDVSGRYETPIARAGGAVYVDPRLNGTTAKARLANQRAGIILGGGVVSKDRDVYFTLHQPNWDRARAIADRINERFERGAGDRFDTAVPKDDTIIQINIPNRFAAQPGELLGLVQHLYVDRGIEFEPAQAKRLAAVATEHPEYAMRIMQAWQSLGKTALPTIRESYSHPNPEVRYAAVSAGARLGDGLALPEIEKMLASSDVQQRLRGALLLRHLTPSLKIHALLRKLLDDDERTIRIAAYEVLSRRQTAVVNTYVIGNRRRPKFLLEIVDAERPMVYINQRSVPRITVFGQPATFKMPLFASIWDGKLMLTGQSLTEPLRVFYQGRTGGKQAQIAPAIGTLLLYLGKKPTLSDPPDGLDLSYSDVIGALFELAEQGHLDAELEFEDNPLAVALAELERRATEPTRPESGAPPIAPGGANSALESRPEIGDNPETQPQ